MTHLHSRLFVAFAMVLISGTAVAQSEDGPLDEEGRLVQFNRDIAPIFSQHCFECHNERNAKNDFRIDLEDSVEIYLDPGDASTSTLFVDYLLSDDPDLLMPPPSHGGPLSPSELALIRVWIDEGAHWPEDAVVRDITAVEEEVEPREPPAPEVQAQSLAARIWAFQGYFHPATVHFPIALLLVGGLFVLVGLRHPSAGEQVALICLFLGTVTAIVASMMGWAFAEQRGYGSWRRFDLDSDIFWHRWSAIFVTVVAVIISLIALVARKKDHIGLHRTWRVGLVLLAAMIGAVGHQGGALTYGPHHYERAFQVLRGEPARRPQPVVPPTEGADRPEADAEEAED